MCCGQQQPTRSYNRPQSRTPHAFTGPRKQPSGLRDGAVRAVKLQISVNICLLAFRFTSTPTVAALQLLPAQQEAPPRDRREVLPCALAGQEPEFTCQRRLSAFLISPGLGLWLHLQLTDLSTARQLIQTQRNKQMVRQRGCEIACCSVHLLLLTCSALETPKHGTARVMNQHTVCSGT